MLYPIVALRYDGDLQNMKLHTSSLSVTDGAVLRSHFDTMETYKTWSFILHHSVWQEFLSAVIQSLKLSWVWRIDAF